VYELAARMSEALMPQLEEVPVAGWGAFEDGVSRVLDTVASERAVTTGYVSDVFFRAKLTDAGPW
jgi:hypothetical protein